MFFCISFLIMIPIFSQDKESFSYEIRYPLHYAVKTGDLSKARELISAGTGVSGIDDKGWTPLYFACSGKNVEMAKLLLENGADLNEKFYYGITPLHMAASNCDMEMAKMLIGRGSDINPPDTDGAPPLFRAVCPYRHTSEEEKKNGATEEIMTPRRIELIKLLLAKGADINYQVDMKRTSLIQAVGCGNLQIVRFLVENGAKINVSGTFTGGDDSPLALALSGNNMDIAKYLIEKGADVNFKPRWGPSPVVLAVSAGSLEMTKLLIEKGANIPDSASVIPGLGGSGDMELLNYLVSKGVDFKTSSGSQNLLDFAVRNGRVEMVGFCLKNGFDINQKGYQGNTPLHIAADSRLMEMARFLVDSGADLAIKNDFGNTPLDEALQAGRNGDVALFLFEKTLARTKDNSLKDRALLKAAWSYELVGSFLGMGADVNCRDEENMTPLHYAAILGAVDVARLLIQKGADLNAKDKFGSTPLHYIALQDEPELKRISPRTMGPGWYEYSREELAELLLDKGASLEAKNNNGKSPLDYAFVLNTGDYEEAPDTDVLSLFLRKGAVIPKEFLNGKGKGEPTPLMAAAYNGDLELVKLLIGKGADPYVEGTLIHNWREGIADSSCFISSAASAGHWDIVRYAIKELKVPADYRTSRYEMTPLMHACSQGAFSSVQELVKLGANPNGRRFIKEKKEPAEKKCVQAGDLAIEIITGADALNTDDGSDFQRPIHVAAAHGHVDIVKFLAENGADIRAKNEDGQRPIHIASAFSQTAVVDYLVGKGIDVNDPDKNGNTPLMLACEGYSYQDMDRGDVTELISYLISEKAKIGARNNEGSTALHFAASSYSLGIVKLLVEKGADVNAVNNMGESPLFGLDDFLEHEDPMEIIKFLVAKGTDLKLKDKTGDTVLHDAVRQRLRKEKIEFYLEHGADADAKNNKEETPYFVAIGEGEYEIAELLLKKKADITIKNTDGDTILHNAVKGYKKDLVQFLLANGSDINGKNAKGETPLHLAASSEKKAEMVGLLIEKGADVNSRDNEGRTPLMVAIRWRRVDSASLLLEKGCDVEAKDNNGMTAMHYACRYDYDCTRESTKLLIDKGANVNAPDKMGNAPLHLTALHSRNADLCRMLLEKGGDNTIRNSKWNNPLMENLCETGSNEDVMNILLREQADLNEKNKDGHSLLILAIQYKKGGIVRRLVEMGANVNLADPNGATPLMYAAKSGRLDVVKMLIAKDADSTKKGIIWLDEKHESWIGNFLNAAAHGRAWDIVYYGIDELKIPVNDLEIGKDGKSTGSAVLHEACGKNEIEAVNELLKRGADVNIEDGIGSTPIFYAVCCNRLEIAKVLLGHGADIDHKNNSGSTPLHIAACNGKLDAVKFLVENKAKIDVTDNEGKTPLQLAVDSKQGEVANYLKSLAVIE